MKHEDGAGREPQGRLATGIAGLDAVLEGGFIHGGMFIIQGHPGTGKTILGNQICFNHAARGGKALFITLLAENHSRMILHLSSLTFFDPHAVPQQVYYISAFTALEQDGLTGLITLIRREAARHYAQVLILDGLVAAERRAASDMEFKKFIHELQLQASMLNCSMFLLTSTHCNDVSAEHTMVDGVLELNYRLQGWRTERNLRVLKRRGADFLAGLHAFDITAAGITVYPRIELTTSRYQDGLARVPGAKIKSGIVALDQMMGGGIPSCSTTLLLGSSGVGKTTLGLQFLSQCSPDERGLLCGFYETPAALAVKASALKLDVAGLMQRGIVEILWTPATEASIDEICYRLMTTVREHQPQRVFIDGLEALQKLAIDSERVAHILSALSMQLQRAAATTMYTAEIEVLTGGQDGDVLSSVTTSNVSSVAENILVMRFVEADAQLYRAISVVKVRDAAIDGRLRLFEIVEGGLHIDGSHARAAAVVSSLRLRQARRPWAGFDAGASKDAPED